MTDTDNFLAHFGVRGMKWGVRNSRSVTKLGPSKDRKAVDRSIKKSKKHGTKSLTNKELEAHNRRAELEKKFHAANPKTHDAVHKHIKEVIATGASAVALYNSPIGKAGRRYIQNLLAGGSSPATTRETTAYLQEVMKLYNL